MLLVQQHFEEEFQKVHQENQTVFNSFNELKRRYDDQKAVIEAYKKNEATLLANLTLTQSECNEAEARFEALKVHAQQKLEEANEEVNNNNNNCSCIVVCE